MGFVASNCRCVAGVIWRELSNVIGSCEFNLKSAAFAIVQKSAAIKILPIFQFAFDNLRRIVIEQARLSVLHTDSGGNHMRTFFAAAIVFALLSATSLFAQNAQLGGIVSDPSGALLPGVTITSTNTATGVVTTTLT